jgi:hypothetical protein
MNELIVSHGGFFRSTTICGSVILVTFVSVRTHVCVCVPLPSRVELVSQNNGGHDSDGDGLHRLEDGGEERPSPVDAPDLQSEGNA